MNILYVTWKETTGWYDIREMKMPESALFREETSVSSSQSPSCNDFFVKVITKRPVAKHLKVSWYVSLPTSSRSLCLQPAQLNFCVSNALFRCPISLLGFTVPKNMDLNWFRPKTHSNMDSVKYPNILPSASIKTLTWRALINPFSFTASCMAYEEISRIPDHNAIIEKFPKPTGFKIMVINHAWLYTKWDEVL